MTHPNTNAALRALVQEAQTLVDSAAAMQAEGPLGDLLARAEILFAQDAGHEVTPVRSLHHLACTGGTLVARCLAAMPNTLLLSELDPLSKRATAAFSPTDVIRHLRAGMRSTPPDTVIDVFLAGLGVVKKRADLIGQRLVVRDHSHSHFCEGPQVPVRISLRDMLRRAFPVVSAVTLRHPLDSFLSLEGQGWRHFAPFTLREYCTRYTAFLDAHDGVPEFRYEDLVAAPERVVAALCNVLALPFRAESLDRIAAIPMSGDSGRRGASIAARPRRPVSAAVIAQISGNDAYDALCARMGYVADPAQPPL